MGDVGVRRVKGQIGTCLLGTRWCNFQPCTPTLRVTMHSATDGRQDDANSRSYCVAVRSAKNYLLYRPTTRTHFADQAFRCFAPAILNSLNTDTLCCSSLQLCSNISLPSDIQACNCPSIAPLVIRHNAPHKFDYCYYQPIVLLHSMIGYWEKPVVRLSVCLSVCDVVHCGSQGWCRGLKVIPACCYHTCSYLSLLLQDVSFSHKMHHKKRSAPLGNIVNVFLSIQADTPIEKAQLVCHNDTVP